MFISIDRDRTGTTDDGQQFSAGEFLILMQRKPLRNGLHPYEPAVRALVRYARLSQLGHWMMGTVRVQHYSLTLSGSYGQDGLPKSVAPAVYAQGIDLPQELYDAWNKGGGHNSAGSEAQAMRKWALANLDALKASKRIDIPDELPDFDSPESLYNWSAVRNVNKDGISFVTMRLEYDYQSFREGRPQYKIRHDFAKVGDAATVSFAQRDLISRSQASLLELCSRELRKHGFDVRNSGVVSPPAAWVPFILQQSGYAPAKVSA